VSDVDDVIEKKLGSWFNNHDKNYRNNIGSMKNKTKRANGKFYVKNMTNM